MCYFVWSLDGMTVQGTVKTLGLQECVSLGCLGHLGFFEFIRVGFLMAFFLWFEVFVFPFVKYCCSLSLTGVCVLGYPYQTTAAVYLPVKWIKAGASAQTEACAQLQLFLWAPQLSAVPGLTEGSPLFLCWLHSMSHSLFPFLSGNER